MLGLEKECGSGRGDVGGVMEGGGGGAKPRGIAKPQLTAEELRRKRLEHFTGCVLVLSGSWESVVRV